MNAPVYNEHTMLSAICAETIGDIERWSDKLDLINRKVISDPDGNEGARLESLILRAQALIGSQASRLLGVDITRFDRARGVAL